MNDSIGTSSPWPVRRPEPWLEIQRLRAPELEIQEWTVQNNQAWCVFGANDSGAGTLAAVLAGKHQQCRWEQLQLPDDLRVVSFETQQERYEEELRNDDSDFLDRVDPGTLARDFLGPSPETPALVELFKLGQVLESGYRQLSSGESRKLLILEAITHGANHLVLENPYDGLDLHSCRELDRVARQLRDRGVGLILLLSSHHDIPGWCTHLLLLEKGQISLRGSRDEVVPELRRRPQPPGWQWPSGAGEDAGPKPPETKELVRLVRGTIRYGQRVILSQLDFTVSAGRHTLITGPNGSGKSTLLAVICGDHPDCYTNELYLFGRRRGTGESIWDLKKQMGIVSPALHRNHRVPGSTLQIVISGFFDSIGLYQQYTPRQAEIAREWLGVLGLQEHAAMPFRRLSFARQRLALIARALIKLPKLLILDEPTQGLDDANRENLMRFLELVVHRQLSTIIYVSHRRDEHRPFFRQQLALPQESAAAGR